MRTELLLSQKSLHFDLALVHLRYSNLEFPPEPWELACPDNRLVHLKKQKRKCSFSSTDKLCLGMLVNLLPLRLQWTLLGS